MTKYWTKERFTNIGIVTMFSFGGAFAIFISSALLHGELTINNVVTCVNLAGAMTLIMMFAGLMGAQMEDSNTSKQE